MEDTMKSVNAAMAMPRATVHMYSKGIRPGRKMGHINLTADSAAELDGALKTLLELDCIVDAVPQIQGRPTPLVGVIMGSQSDLPTMQAAVDMLEKFDIPCEVDIVSAHRTPDKLVSYSRSAATRGMQVIIAGAGGAAHLPGMVAALTPLPVVGVPIKTSTLNGQDSLLSIVQMPRGIPVATVAIGNATNAGLLAVRMLCGSRPELREKMEAYQVEMRKMVEGTSERLLEQGSKQYLDGMANKSTSVNV
jgi:phosphoribosylaminoimidazole carboxylase